MAQLVLRPGRAEARLVAARQDVRQPPADPGGVQPLRPAPHLRGGETGRGAAGVVGHESDDHPGKLGGLAPTPQAGELNALL